LHVTFEQIPNLVHTNAYQSVTIVLQLCDRFGSTRRIQKNSDKSSFNQKNFEAIFSVPVTYLRFAIA